MTDILDPEGRYVPVSTTGQQERSAVIDLTSKFKFSNLSGNFMSMRVFLNLEKCYLSSCVEHTDYGTKLKIYDFEKNNIEYKYAEGGAADKYYWSPLINFVAPFIFKFYNNKNQFMFQHKFDPTMKIIQLNLEPRKDEDLIVWLDAIKRFKDIYNCEIVLSGENLNKNIIMPHLDSGLITTYLKEEEGESIEKNYYASFDVGFFYDDEQTIDSNSFVCDWVRNPDGHKGKTALDIINDILFFSENVLPKKFLDAMK
jgi:hypothetical protein